MGTNTRTINGGGINAAASTSGNTPLPGTDLRWKIALRLAGVDWSDRLTGQVVVEAEESAARIAEFVLAPESGPITVPDLVGVSVEIDFLVLDSAGVVQETHRLFTGRLDLPDYDMTQQVIRCSASDGLQDRQEAMTQAAIAAEIGGRWSAALFDAEADGWTYTQDRLSTQPYAFDLAADGMTARLTAWATKPTPDYTLGVDDFVYDSLAVELLPRRDLTNVIDITVQYRYQRRRHRAHSLGWAWQNGAAISFCDWFSETTTLPNRTMVLGALNGTGWWIDTISWGQLPASDPDPCNTGAAWVISEEVRAELVFSFSANIYRRQTQPVTETYEVQVRAPQSVTQYGELVRTERASLETESDTEDWERVEDTFLPPGGYTDGIGDWVMDMDDATERTDAVETGLAVGRTRILEAHRRNRVRLSMPIAPVVDLVHTVRVESPRVKAQGKVARLVHTADLDAGTAVTELNLAVSRTGSQAPGVEDALIAPSAPDTTPAIAQPPSSSSMLTQIGGKVASPTYDEDQNGYSGNYSIIEGGGVIYPVRFLAEAPEIESEVRSNVEGTAQATYNTNIPNDLLEVAAL